MSQVIVPARTFTPVKRQPVEVVKEETEPQVLISPFDNPLDVEKVHQELYINNVLPGLSIHEPTALLLDMNNLFKRAAERKFRIDYGKLRDVFSARCDLRYAAAYTAIDRDDDKAEGWLRYMTEHAGFDIISKDLYRYMSDDGRQVAKGNVDIELTIGAMKLSPSFTHVIIGTCDGDFTPLVEELKSDHARKVSVLGITAETGVGVSRSLLKACDNFYDMNRIREHIEYLREGI